MSSSTSFRILSASAAASHAVKEFVIPTMAKLYPPGAFNADPDDLKYFDDVYVRPADACFYIAVDTVGRIVGTAAARPYDGRFPFMKNDLDGRKACEITKVYIDDGLRRQGLGASLYREVEEYIRNAGYEIAYLHNTTRLPGGYPFWLSRGYTECFREAGSIVHMTKLLGDTAYP